METYSTVMSRMRLGLGATLLALAIFIAHAIQSHTLAQEDRAAYQAEGQSKAAEKEEAGMSCPMMAAMKGIKLRPHSPQLLIAKADELNLTDAQQRELSEIAKSASDRARDVLTAEQREELGQPAEQPMSVMEIAKTRMKDKMIGEGRQQMCPMCMKMMQKTMSRDDIEGHEGHPSDQ